jgi:hypothetical protein
MESRPAPREPGKASQEKVDVEDWLRYFGLEKTNR